MSISSDLAKLLRQAGTDPNLYDTDRLEPDDYNFKNRSSTKKEKNSKPLTKATLQQGKFSDILSQLNVDSNLYRDDHWEKKLPIKGTLMPNIEIKPNYDKVVNKSKTLYVPPLQESSKKMEYKFRDYKWLSNMAGFNMPSDVFYGNVLLGVIESQPDGYIVLVVMGPHRPELIKQDEKNKFKTKEEAAEIMHKIWSSLRKPNMKKPTEPDK